MNTTDKFKAEQYLAAGGALSHFMSINQRRMLEVLICGEEGAEFVSIVIKLKSHIDLMPKTGESEGQGEAAQIQLHYFIGGYDAWILEKDVGSPNDDVVGVQTQAFGWASFGGKGDAEMGYVSIQEAIENGAELDLYWTPKTWAAI